MVEKPLPRAKAFVALGKAQLNAGRKAEARRALAVAAEAARAIERSWSGVMMLVKIAGKIVR
jgi:Tfp pilus assembly protein PilF